MKKIYWKLHLLFTGLPARGRIAEVRKTWQFCATYTDLSQTMDLYIAGSELEEIAAKLNLSRERVRQLLLKANRHNG